MHRMTKLPPPAIIAFLVLLNLVSISVLVYTYIHTYIHTVYFNLAAIGWIQITYAK